MHEELIHELLVLSEEPCDAYYEAATALKAQTAQLAAKDAEIARLNFMLNSSKDVGIKRGREIARVTAENSNLRNELCQQCGKYHTAHKGACDGCRWRTPEKQDEEG